MLSQSKIYFVMLIFLSFSSLFMLSCGSKSVSEMSQQQQQESTGSNAPQSSGHNETLLAAASPFEDLIDFAEAGDQDNIQATYDKIRSQVKNIKQTLSSEMLASFDSHLQAIRQGIASSDNTTVALHAAETYRLLISSLDKTTLIVPVEVSLLDYAGFKLNVLANAKSPDFGAMTNTVTEARGFWDAIQAKVKEKGLHDVMNTAIEGMEQAAAKKNLDMAAFAAQVDLDLVDLLEHYFKTKSPK